jgi:hypothetical protein
LAGIGKWLAAHGLSALKKRDHTLISCSSRAVEFQSLLTDKETDPLEEFYSTAYCRSEEGSTQVVLNGGFPINFDRKTERERPEDITLTRAIVFAAVLQAVTLPSGSARTIGVRLDPRCQMLIVRRWLSQSTLDFCEFGVTDSDILDLRWWKDRSRGINVESG